MEKSVLTMKPLLINTSDFGGAAKACIRLHSALLAEGIDSHLQFQKWTNPNVINTFIYNLETNQKSSIQNKLKQKLKRILAEFKLHINDTSISKEEQFIKNRPSGLEWFTFPTSNFDLTASPFYQETDIINLHWVANYIDFPSFFRKNKKPIVWTLHDQNPFLGGEHFNEKFLINNRGELTPRIKTKREQQVEKDNLLLKKEALSKVDNIHIVALSNWMYNKVKESELFKGFPVSIIPNSINSNIFKPFDKYFSRDVFNLPKGKKIILFISDSLEKERKGFKILNRALNLIDQKNIYLCAVGKQPTDTTINPNIHFTGVIRDERLMSLIYSAADIFVIPSILDNLPNTVLESLACGTPVIGFKEGGIPDMVNEGTNGLLANETTPESLANTLSEGIQNLHKFDRTVISATTSQKYSQKNQANSYISIFEKMLNS